MLRRDRAKPRLRNITITLEEAVAGWAHVQGTYSVHPDCTGTFTINNSDLTNPQTGKTTSGAIIVVKFVLSDHGRAIHTVVTALTPPGAPGPVPALIRSEGHKL